MTPYRPIAKRSASVRGSSTDEGNPNPLHSPDAHDRSVLTHLSNDVAKPLETRVPVESPVPQLLDFDGRDRKRWIEHPQIADGGKLDRQRTWDRRDEIRPGDDERNTDEVGYLQANSPMQALCSQTDLDDILDAPFLRDDDVLGREIIIQGHYGSDRRVIAPDHAGRAMLKQKLLLEDGRREVGEVADGEVDFAQIHRSGELHRSGQDGLKGHLRRFTSEPTQESGKKFQLANI